MDAITGLGSHDGNDPHFLHQVARRNVELTLEQSTQRSAILKELLEKSTVGLAGDIYDMETGGGEFIEPRMTCQDLSASAGIRTNHDRDRTLQRSWRKVRDDDESPVDEVCKR